VKIEHRIFGLLTARDGSKSVVNKNIMDINGKPLFFHNVEAAKDSKYIERLYVSTDSDFIKNFSSDYCVIDRPYELCTDNASHHDTMIHGINEIEIRERCNVDIIVILLGNANGAKTYMIDESIEILLHNPEIDSILSVSEFNMFNPFRAFKIKEDGLLDTIVEQDFIEKSSIISNINDKKSAGNCYFFNGSFMVCRKDAIMKKCGKFPFLWLGNRIQPYHMDVSMEIDAPWQVLFINREK
jgi:N-acylneuraminate cytidylyltransferase